MITATQTKPNPRRGLPSASYFPLYANCPGAFHLIRNADEESNSDLERGRRVHEAIEEGDVSDLGLSEQDLVIRIRQREEEIYTAWCDEMGGIKDAEIIRERRFWGVLGGVRFSGQIDTVFMSHRAKCCCILDAKSGRKAVPESPRNWQLRAQAVLVGINHQMSHARVGIIQPLAKAQPLTDYSANDLYRIDGAMDQTEALLKKITDPEAPRTPGVWCANCAARGICPEAAGYQNSIVALEGFKWSALAPDRKRELWEKAAIATKIIKQIQTAIKKDVAAGLIPGLTISEPTHPREITSTTKLFELLNELIPNPAFRARFDEMSSVTLGALESYVAEQMSLSKVEAQAWINDKLREVITTTEKAGHVIPVPPKEITK